MRLKDKVAIITGGSRGIGFATADKFLKEGATVVSAASSKESADTAVDKLKEKYPNAIVAGISPNLASMESVRKALKRQVKNIGCVDILVNNAGISENTSFMDYVEETFDKVIDLNVKGVFNVTRVAAECMVVPIVEKIAGERRDIKVGKINVDEEPELANKFSIMSIPTLVVMKNGKIVQQVSGARPKNAILEML